MTMHMTTPVDKAPPPLPPAPPAGAAPVAPAVPPVTPPAALVTPLAPSTPPPVTVGPAPPAPHKHTLLINNPLTNADAHASQYAFISEAIGFGVQELVKKYPWMDRHWATRFAELALNVGGLVPLMVFSHEGGHYRVADAHQWKPHIEMTGWASGLTRYSGITLDNSTPEQRTQATAAGVNQEQLNAAYMFRDWALGGDARYQEALGFLLARTNMALYALRSATRGKDKPSSDDISNYIRQMNQSGRSTGYLEVAGFALAADLLSPAFWASLYGTGRFVVTGERSVRVPAIDLAGARLTLPNFHLFLGAHGPIFGGETFLSFKNGPAVSLGADVRTDGRGGAVTLGGYGLSAGPVSFSPSLGLSTDAQQGLGFSGRLSATLQATPWLGLTADGGFNTKGWMKGPPQGQAAGFSGNLGLTFTLP